MIQVRVLLYLVPHSKAEYVAVTKIAPRIYVAYCYAVTVVLHSKACYCCTKMAPRILLASINNFHQLLLAVRRIPSCNAALLLVYETGTSSALSLARETREPDVARQNLSQVQQWYCPSSPCYVHTNLQDFVSLPPKASP